MTGKSCVIEKSKQKMVAEDIKRAIEIAGQLLSALAQPSPTLLLGPFSTAPQG